MATYLTNLFRTRAQDFIPVGDFQISVKASKLHTKSGSISKAAQGTVSTLSNMWEKTKGVADLFGLVSRSSALAQEVIPEKYVPWTAEVGTTFSGARNALSVPYFLTTIKKTSETGDYRDGIEAVGIGGFAMTNFLSKGALSNTFGQIGSIFKTAADGIDAQRSFDEYQKYSQLVATAEKLPVATSAVKEGLATKLKETTFKLLKYALAFFSGMVAIAKFALGLTLSKPIAIAALADRKSVV